MTYVRAATVCRGCAGTGIDHKVPARIVQQILDRKLEGVKVIPREHNGVKSGEVRYCTITVSATEGKARLHFAGPLTPAVRELRRRQDEGFDFESHGPVVLPEQAHACDWCSGTGKPQLSVHTLATAVARKEPA